MIARLLRSACLTALFAGTAACGPDPGDAPPVGEAPAQAAQAATGTAPPSGTPAPAGAQAEFRLAIRDAREQLLRDLADCAAAAASDPGCDRRALRAYDVAVADAGRRTGLRADEIVPLDVDAFAEGMPLVQVSGNRG